MSSETTRSGHLSDGASEKLNTDFPRMSERILLKQIYRLIVSSLLALPFLCQAAEPLPVDVSSPSLWSVEGASADAVKLSERKGILGITFDADVQKSRRIQHNTVFEEGILLKLKEPVVIPSGQERLFFEARGQDGSAESRKGTVFLRPVLEDERGERFSYEPYRVPALKDGGPQDWTQWTTRPFLTSEAGGASPNIYVVSGEDSNGWPDGRLKLIGFELRLRVNTAGSESGRKSGEIFLGDVALAPTRIVEEAPSAFADAFLKDKGSYQAAFEVRSSFQAAPITEVVTSLDFDPADENSRRQKIAVPPAETMGNSWLRYQIANDKGDIAAEGNLRWETDRPAVGSGKQRSVDLQTPPAVGLTRINPDRYTEGVYPPGQPLEVQVRVFDSKTDRKPAKLKWSLKSYSFDKTLGEGSESIALKGKNSSDILIKPEVPDDETAFRLEYSILAADDTVLDKGTYILGKGGEIQPLQSRTGNLSNRHKIKEQSYNRITFHDGGSPKTEEDVLKRFAATVDQASPFTNHITYMVDLSDLEVLPGVYDYHLLDKIMDIASDYRFGVTVRLAHAEMKKPYLWLPYSKVRDFDGGVVEGHPLYKAVSMADGAYMDTWVRGYRALYDRYKEHPAFEGYYLMMPNGEMVLPEEVWHGKISDYSQGAQKAFRVYLEQDLGLSLDDLNTRWGSSFKSWEDVPIPQPDWTTGTAPDLRREWIDFSRFKMMLTDDWCKDLAARVREFDQDRIIISYGDPDRHLKPDGTSDIDYGHNGGNHFLKNEGRYVKAWNGGKGIGWITEPHHPHRWAAYGDPAQAGWVLDWSTFVMLAQAGGGGANLHYYFFPNPGYSLVEHYGGEYSYDRVEQMKPILRELHGLEIVAPIKQVAGFFDPETVYAKHRTTFGGRMIDMARWFELLTADSVPWEEYIEANRANYKAVFVNPLDEVLSRQSIDALDETARGGATLVMTATTGRYTSDDASAQFPLLAKLGIEKPVGTWDTSASELKAAVEPKFRDLLSRDALRFYSQADMKKEIADPAIGADFYRWPYRWLPQSDYFGYFKDNKITSGEVLARFPDGGVALSRHPVGKGSALVFWGSPDMTPDRIDGLLGRIADMTGVSNPQAGNEIPYMLEGHHRDLNRYYTLLYQEVPGTYRQKFPNAPDGEWFIDDMISSQRLGTFEGRKLREEGIELTFPPGVSPLKVLRLYQPEKVRWLNKYPQQAATSSSPKS